MATRAHHPGDVRALVLSEHEAVRRELVAYLARTAGLEVTGDHFSVDGIRAVHPQVVVLDLSRLSHRNLVDALAAAGQVGARIVALASVSEPSEERAVTRAGGLYRLKAGGADGLAETILMAAHQPAGCTPISATA
ncbi:MAG: response regulator transcription factor [Chloroflexi bacterium]|nr:response regulator transcription factor [Chloroflexota bacterium]